VAALLVWLLLVVVPFSAARPAYGFTPESPEVQEMLDKAFEYLANASDHRVGGACLVGLCFVKRGEGDTHPKVAEAVRRCQDMCRNEPGEIRVDIYSTGLALIFLCELDPSKYQPEIARLFQSLVVRQKSHGGWGYAPPSEHALTGDTSMTQYAVLGSWTSQRSGALQVAPEVVERVCNWLIRTQDPSGGWGYQGNDPGEGNYQRIQQQNVRHALAAAGLGSLYICADLLGVVDIQQPEREPGLPPALSLVEPEPAAGQAKPAEGNVSRELVRRAMIDGDRWFRANYRIDPDRWPLYYMYALERWQSFRELALNRIEAEPGWYNDGVRYLKVQQQPDGRWEAEGGPAVDTAFAVLFLMRSTRKMIESAVKEYGDGRLVGGRGLPKNTADIRVRKGQIESVPLTTSADEVLAILEDQDNPDLELALQSVADLTLSEDPRQRQGQLARLRQLVTTGPYEARRAAVQALARRRDLDDVPTLIYALSDPDVRVVRQAHDALCYVSRSFTSPALPAQPTETDKQVAIRRWKAWYLSLRPDAEFLD